MPFQFWFRDLRLRLFPTLMHPLALLPIGKGRVLGAIERLGNAVLPSSAERQRRRALHLIERSALFDRDWYLEQYPDVAGSGVDPARHFLNLGWHEGRDPGPGFSTTAYLRANADVAALAVNPLLHYVEHGHAEGRGAPDHAAPVRLALKPPESFEPAGPCATFPREAGPALRWRRQPRPGAEARATLWVDGRFVGEHRDHRAKRDFEAAFALLEWLSGADPAKVPQGNVLAVSQAFALIDAWHGGQRLLRTRWNMASTGAIVMRAIQWAGEGPALVGEGLVKGSLDVFDAKLTNPLFPILFVFADPEGRIEGWQLLAFPSLCRGGLHYSELLAAAHGSSGLQQYDSELVDRYRSLFDGDTVPLIASLGIDARGADGTHPLFQPDFREWLGRVARLPIGNDVTGPRSAGELPNGAREGRDGGRVLMLPSNMVPTLAIVFQRRDADPDAAPTGRGSSFIVAGDERARPAALISLPPGCHDDILGDFIPFYPVLMGAAGWHPLPPLAIRMPRSRPLNEAELLVPIAAPALAVEPSAALDFIVPTRGRSDDELAEALQTLALQIAVDEISLTFLVKPTIKTAMLAARLFKSVRVAEDMKAAAAMTRTPLVGYLGRGVLLHDRRTVAHLAGMASKPGVASASAVLVSVERRGRGWNIIPVDAGEFAVEDGNRPELALSVWRATFANRRPPSALWLARRANLEAWIDGATEAAGFHLCTSRVTATSGPPETDVEGLRPPPSAATMQIEMLVG